MIIRTRYRDVPWEEVKNCYPPVPPGYEDFWEKCRGREIEILSGPIPISDIQSPEYGCGGPYYGVPTPSGGFVVCPHIAEIGD